MQWRGGRQSSNVDDRRGRRVPGGAKGLGLIGIVLALGLAWMSGDPSALLSALLGGGGVSSAQVSDAGPASAQEEELRDFVATVLASTEDVWREQLAKNGSAYRDPTLVLFRGAVESACGQQSSAVGPFYCPGDEQVYLDLGFFDELRAELGAPGDFAQAYVIAHEVGHHVQNLLGTSEQVRAAQARSSDAESNELSVRLELQADFYAGLWAHHAQSAKLLLEQGDLEEAFNAAQKIGDDNLQRRFQGHVVPESFTHGSSAQRMRWFKKGLESGDLAAGNTFGAGSL
jgi:predicted metalloprotease